MTSTLRHGIRLAAAALFGASLGGACLELEPTPKRTSDAGVQDATLSDVPGLEDVGDVGDCVGACLAQHPAAVGKFLAIAACVDAAQASECSERCAPDASDDTMSSCPIPAPIHPNPTCNACLRDACCSAIGTCLEDMECLAVAICAEPCGR